MFKKYVIVFLIALNLTGIAIKASEDYAWQEEKQRLIKELADADAAWHSKNSPITYAIFSTYTKILSKQPYGRSYGDFVAIEDETHMKARISFFSEIETMVLDCQDKLETPSETVTTASIDKLDSKITMAIEAKRKKLGSFQKQTDVLWLDEYTKCNPPVYLGFEEGWIKCITLVPQSLRSTYRR